jgi:hypothetical protein
MQRPPLIQQIVRNINELNAVQDAQDLTQHEKDRMRVRAFPFELQDQAGKPALITIAAEIDLAYVITYIVRHRISPPGRRRISRDRASANLSPVPQTCGSTP